MNAKELQVLFESYLGLLRRKEQLYEKLLHSSGYFPLLEELTLKKHEEVDQKLKFINYVLFESNILTEEQKCMLSYRMDGYSLEKIGEKYATSHTNITKKLKRIYTKIEKELKTIKI